MERDAEKQRDSAVTLDDIILAGIERGLGLSDIKKMTLGQVVDYVIAYNDRQKAAEKAQKLAETKGSRRKASQSDINAFFG